MNLDLLLYKVVVVHGQEYLEHPFYNIFFERSGLRVYNLSTEKGSYWTLNYLCVAPCLNRICGGVHKSKTLTYSNIKKDMEQWSIWTVKASKKYYLIASKEVSEHSTDKTVTEPLVFNALNAICKATLEYLR